MKNSVHFDGFCRSFNQKNKLGRNYPVPCYPSVYRVVNSFYRDLEVGVDVLFHSQKTEVDSCDVGDATGVELQI